MEDNFVSLEPNLIYIEQEKTCEDLQNTKKKQSMTTTDDGEENISADLGPYSYVQRDTYTSEIFKIELHNLPHRVGIVQLRKRLNSNGLQPSKIKIIDQNSFAFINFRSEEDRQKALTVLQGHKWKGRDLTVKKANPAADPWLKKKQERQNLGESTAGVVNDDGPVVKKPCLDIPDNIPVYERLNNVVSPLWKIPYEEQLKTKEEEIRKYLKNLGRAIESNNSDMKQWLALQRKTNSGLCCKLDCIKPSPVLSEYRNKCEFTVGDSFDNQEKVVGFRFGQYRNGEMTVGEPENVIFVPQIVKQVAKVIQNYLQQHSPYKGYEPVSKEGHWRTITVRSNQQGHVMLICGFLPQKLSADQLNEERERLKQFMANHGSIISSLYFTHEGNNSSSQTQEFYHLFGNKVIEETLLNMRFQVSPSAFFQVNTKAAEVLYNTIKEYCSVTADTVLLDICCGTGTIGLSMAQNVSKIIGVELCSEAVENARENAKLNGISNAEFHCGLAEKLIPSLLSQLPTSGVVAVADPPRPGLHNDVIRAIRRCSAISRLVYVSCNPTGAKQNIIDLTRTESKKYRGRVFNLQKAVPIDLFPHTEHCELVLLLER